MKTAIEHLQAEFNKWAEGRVFIPQDLLEEAKRLEKEQILAAYNNGSQDMSLEEKYEPLEYYNQTYGK